MAQFDEPLDILVNTYLESVHASDVLIAVTYIFHYVSVKNQNEGTMEDLL